MLSAPQQWPLILSAAIALINIEQTGMCLGWSSPVLARLQSNDSSIPTTADEGSWIASTLALGSLISTPLPILGMNYIGRKHTICLAFLPYLVSWIMIGVATTTTELIIARLIAGIGMSITNTVTPVYLGEISPDALRDSVGFCMGIIVNVGTLLIYWIGGFPQLWLSSLLSAIPLVVIIIFYYWLPESPYYLLINGRRDEALAELKKLRNTENVEKEIKEIESNVMKITERNSYIEIFKNPGHRRALIICMGTITFAQFTGRMAFIFYAHLIFQKAGLVSINTMSMIKASIQVLLSVLATFVVDHVGKKPLLILSCIGMAFTMACEGVYFYLLDNEYNVETIWWLPLTAMVLFEMSLTIGVYPISFLYMGELFHANVKTAGVCVSKSYLSISTFMVGKLFQVMMDAFGNSTPFFLFSIMGILGVFFVVQVVPETKGKSLADIQYYMEHKKYQDKEVN